MQPEVPPPSNGRRKERNLATLRNTHSVEPSSMPETRIFRSPAQEPFTVLLNEFLQARGELLSPEAIGVGAHLLSRPPNWSVSIKMLQLHHGIGREKVRRILSELARAGHAGRFAVRDEKGRLRGQYWVLATAPYSFGERPANHILIFPTVRPESRPLATPSVGSPDRRMGHDNKRTELHKEQKENKREQPFPVDGTIMWSRWGEIAREELRHHGRAMPDIDFVAANFRRWCISTGIALDAARIEKTFRGFCRKVGPA